MSKSWIYDTNSRNVLFIFLNITLVFFINRALSCNNSSITNTRPAYIAQSTTATGNLLKMIRM